MIKYKVGKILIYIILIMVSVIMVTPFLWMVLYSFKSTPEILTGKSLFPQVWTLNNYTTVLNTVPIFTWFKNSVFVTVISTLLILLTSTLLGFIFAKYKFKGKELAFWFILVTMMVPSQATMIPTFILINKIGLYDNLLALILPGVISGFGIFLCRQFIEDLPDSLCEAALIDGAGSFYIYFKIIIPLIRPAIGALTIFTFLQYWNDYLSPLLYIAKPENMTLSLAISFFNGQRQSDVGAIMAASTLIMIPVTVVFLAFQKQFIKGIATTGMK